MRYTCTLRDGAGSLERTNYSCTHYYLPTLMQRHRLHAFGEFERGQAGRPDFRKTDSPHSLLAWGVRASFRAWI